MAIYENSYDDAKRVITNGWVQHRSKPHLFAHVQIPFGQKWMVDYTETYIRPGLVVVEDLRNRIDDICTGPSGANSA